MSFADASNASSSRSITIPLNATNSQSGISSSDQDAAFRALWDAVSNLIFQVSSNVSTIQRLVSLLGGARDTPEMRQQLHDVTERTRKMIKTTSVDLKRLMAFQATDDNRQIRIIQKKLSKDFEEVLKRFQDVSKIAAEKSREYVSKARALQIADDEGNENEPLLGRSDQLSQLQVLDAEVEFNEALIAEREQDIIGIEKSMQEINEIFRDLGTLVSEQQYLLNNIESNVNSAVVNVEGAHSELRTASTTQQRSRSIMCWIFIILLIITLIVVAVLHPWTWLTTMA
eukprot:jgi/Hompol1/7092/HPOL_000738-RA